MIGTALTGIVALFAVEGFAAERYAQTPRGKEEARRAKEEGALIYRQARQHILRPDVLGGLVGLGEGLVL